MEALAGYASEDSDNEVAGPAAVINSKGRDEDVVAAEKSGSKVLSISFLPSEIQAGLRGELDDSDEDGEARSAVESESVGKSGPSRGKKADSGAASGLLKMLPNPKNEYETKAPSNLSKSSGSDGKWVLPSASTAAVKAVREAEEDEEEDAGSNLLFSSAHRARKVSEAKESAASTTSIKAVSADMQAYHQAAFAQQQQQNNVAPAAERGTSSGGGNKRKRDRELEQQLLSGNMAALDEADGVNTRDMQIDGGTWAKEEYLARKKEEAKIRQEFNVSEASMGMGGNVPNAKMQKSKHQLSSLAAQAVRDKINLMERKKVQKTNLDDRRAKYGF